MLGQIVRSKCIPGGWYSFARIPDENRDIFLHKEDILNSESLPISGYPARGSVIEFDLQEDDGKLRARNVTLTGEGLPVVRRQSPPRASRMFEKMADRYNE